MSARSCGSSPEIDEHKILMNPRMNHRNVIKVGSGSASEATQVVQCDKNPSNGRSLKPSLEPKCDCAKIWSAKDKSRTAESCIKSQFNRESLDDGIECVIVELSDRVSR